MGIRGWIKAWLPRHKAAPRADRGVAGSDPVAEEARAAAERCYLEGAQHLAAARLTEAEEALVRAIELRHDYAEAHFQLGEIFRRQSRPEDARDSYVLATCFRPDFQEAYLGLAAFDEGRFRDSLEPLEQALALCNRLLERDPTLAEARLNRALLLLRKGDFARAWPDYEARKMVRSNFVPRSLPWPQWDGAPLAGRTIFIHGEQGLGDEIMFASCYADAVARAGRCVIERVVRAFDQAFVAGGSNRPGPGD